MTARTWSYEQWYRENRESLSRRRKEKYRNDPAYRLARINSARRSYSTEKLRGRPVIDRKIVRRADGSAFFSIGHLSVMINRGIQTIREYHKKGVIPAPRFFDSRGWRLYTPNQMRLMRSVFRDFDEGRLSTLKDVERTLRLSWEERSNGKEQSA